MLLVSAAIAGVNRAGQEILARSTDPTVRSALSSSPATCQEVVDRLVKDRNPQVRRYALRRSTDTEALVKALEPGRRGLLTAAAAANPLAPIGLLREALASADRAVRLAAWCNPTTPEEDRRTLDSSAADLMVMVGGSLADQVIRAHHLVLSNPWMAENPRQWSGTVRRALAALSALTREQVEDLRSVSSHGRAPLGAHPALQDPSFLAGLDHAGRVALGSPAADLQMVADPLLGIDDLAEVLRRTEPEPEPIVIASAVRRFGPGILLEELGKNRADKWSGTRFDAASWSEPVIGFLQIGDGASIPGFQHASDMLGENISAWETFLSLLLSWHTSIPEAAATALSL